MSQYIVGMLSAVAILLLALLIFYAFIKPRIEKLEDGILFQPTVITNVSGYIADPLTTLNLVYDNVWLNKQLKGWHIPYIPGQKAERVILYMHGNGGNIQNTLGFVKTMHDHGFDIFTFDYRGYGESEGVPSEKTIKEDGLNALHALVHTYDYAPEAIILYGHSLGGAVAIDVAARSKYGPKLAGLVTEGTFINLKERACDSSRWFRYIKLHNKFPSHLAIQYVKCPTLLVHSRDDEIINYRHVEELGQHLNYSDVPQFHIVNIRGKHNSPIYTEEFFLRLKDL